MAKKARKKKRKFSEPNFYFKKTGERCLHMEIKFTIKREHLIGTIYRMLTYDGLEDEKYPEDKITTKNIEAKLKRLMHNQGNDWVEEDWDHQESKRWIAAEKFARELYPHWFTNANENSVRFITGD